MKTLKKWKVSFSIGLLHALEYRFDFFISLVGTIFPICIQVFLWLAIYQDARGDAIFYGYTFSQMIAYVVIASTVNKAVNTGVENTINDDIHTGGLAKYLTRPVNYIMFRFMQTAGQQSLSFICVLGFSLITITVLYFAVDFAISLLLLPFFALALCLGIILNFFVFFIISMSAFWLTEAGAFFMTVQVIVMVVSGGVFPVSVFGSQFVFVMRYLPFIYTTYFPIQVMTGALSLREVVTGLGVQIFWIMVLSLLAAFIWKKGLRHYVAVGS